MVKNLRPNRKNIMDNTLKMCFSNSKRIIKVKSYKTLYSFKVQNTYLIISNTDESLTIYDCVEQHDDYSM